MARRSELPQSPRHILIFDEDWEFLKAAYDRNHGHKPLGVSVAVRAIIHSYVKRLKANADLAASEAQAVEAEVKVEDGAQA